MIKPSVPKNEIQRLNSLHQLNLNVVPEERFDRMTRIARKLFDVPYALISLVDFNHQWFKSCEGLNFRETARDISFCGHAILQDKIFIVENAAQDPRFWDNPLVIQEPFIRFYLGCPLKVEEECNIGTLCLLDNKPRSLSSIDLDVLRDFADMVQADLKSTQLSTIDELTGLTNRRGFIAIANHVFNLCIRDEKPMSLLFFDLDNFKSVNDSYGHLEGDRVLNLFAQALMHNFRGSDVIARLGGDEFCVFCSGVDNKNIVILLQRFDESMKKSENQISYSVGCIQYDEARHASIHELLQDADRKMYQNKHNKI